MLQNKYTIKSLTLSGFRKFFSKYAFLDIFLIGSMLYSERQAQLNTERYYFSYNLIKFFLNDCY